jgi:hypothetical protein
MYLQYKFVSDKPKHNYTCMIQDKFLKRQTQALNKSIALNQFEECLMRYYLGMNLPIRMKIEADASAYATDFKRQKNKAEFAKIFLMEAIDCETTRVIKSIIMMVSETMHIKVILRYYVNSRAHDDLISFLRDTVRVKDMTRH